MAHKEVQTSSDTTIYDESGLSKNLFPNIRDAKDLIDEAVRQIARYQRGEDKPIKTRRQIFNDNCTGGIFKGMVITIAGMSGGGKTYLLQQIEDDIFNKSLNPDCDDYLLVRCNWEMSVYNLLLRRIKRTIGKTAHQILTESHKLTDEEKEKIKYICDLERSPNIKYLQQPLSPKDWIEEVGNLLKEYSYKKHIVVTIDHVALIKSQYDKKQAMDTLMEGINELRKVYKNVSFIILSQLNREIEQRKNVAELAPMRSDLYNSDTMFHLSDIVLVVHNPYKLHHNRYMVVAGLMKDSEGKYIDKYEHLREFMTSPEARTTNFNTYGCIFHHYIKIREDEEVAKTISIEKMKLYKPQTQTQQSDSSEQKTNSKKRQEDNGMASLFPDTQFDDLPVQKRRISEKENDSSDMYD